MPKFLQVRTLTDDERQGIERVVRSRTAPVRHVERARIVWFSSQGHHVPAIAAAVRVNPATVRLWLRRFNAQGLPGLADAPRSGHPPTYTAEQVGEVIATALTNPQSLGLPFGSWTLDRLAAYLHEQRGLPIKRSRIDDLLRAEGLRWRTQETWFGERPGWSQAGAGEAAPDAPPVDPEFAQKRG